MTVRAVSYGGGVQSTALLVLAAEGVIDFPLFVFSNVGDDAENPATMDYLAEHARPYAEAHGIDLVEVQRRHHRTGEKRSLLADVTGPGRSIIIPVRMANGAPGRRRCTPDYKLRVVARYLRDAHGATAGAPATVAVGFSTDEWERASTSRAEAWEEKVFPLLDLGHDRTACANLIARAGLPVPPKSACWFCPFHKPSEWARMAREEPETFAASVRLERQLIDKRAALGKDPAYFTRFGRPLDQAIGPMLNQGAFDFAELDTDEDEQYRCGDVCDT